jgi:hypothetical protein
MAGCFYPILLVFRRFILRTAWRRNTHCTFSLWFDSTENLVFSTWCLILPSCNPNPCENNLLKLILEGEKRLESKPVSKKEPITVDILQRLMVLYSSDPNNLLLNWIFRLYISLNWQKFACAISHGIQHNHWNSDTQKQNWHLQEKKFCYISQNGERFVSS